MKAKTARRILRKNHLAIVRKEHFSPSRQRELKEAVSTIIRTEEAKKVYVNEEMGLMITQKDMEKIQKIQREAGEVKRNEIELTIPETVEEIVDLIGREKFIDNCLEVMKE